MARILLSIVVIALLALNLVAAQRRQLVAVKAGTGPFDPSNVIGVLRTNRNGGPLEICPGLYPEGFSIECRGTDVNANVEFFVNDMRVQTEGRAPFHIAGDRDRVELTEIFPFEDFRNEQRCDIGKQCAIRIKCTYNRNNGVRTSITRRLRILADGCELVAP